VKTNYDSRPSLPACARQVVFSSGSAAEKLEDTFSDEELVAQALGALATTLPSGAVLILCFHADLSRLGYHSPRKAHASHVMIRVWLGNSLRFVPCGEGELRAVPSLLPLPWAWLTYVDSTCYIPG